MNDLSWATMTLQEIKEISDSHIKIKTSKQYYEQIKILIAEYPDYIDTINKGYSIDFLYNLLQELESEKESEYLFPGDKVVYYPIIYERKANKIRTCAISGALIYPKSNYITFKAFLYNKTQKMTYVSKPIFLEDKNNYNLPCSLHEFEKFYYRINNSYELNLEKEYNILTITGGISLKRLK